MFDEDITISLQDSVLINVPWPLVAKRHMSDMDIDNNNILWASATSDPGDNGPYETAIYKIGSFSFKNENINFNVAESFPKQFEFANNKQVTKAFYKYFQGIGIVIIIMMKMLLT